MGGGALLSILRTQRDAAANYICPVWMRPCAPPHGDCLWCSQLRRKRQRTKQARALVYREPSTWLKLLFPFCCCWGEGCWGEGERNRLFLRPPWGGGKATEKRDLLWFNLQQVQKIHQERSQVLARRHLEFRRESKANKPLGSSFWRGCAVPLPREPPSVGPRGGEGAGRVHGDEEKGLQNVFFKTTHLSGFLHEIKEGINSREAPHQKILKDATEGRNFLIFQRCSSSGCRNRTVSSEAEPVRWPVFYCIVEKPGSKTL